MMSSAVVSNPSAECTRVWLLFDAQLEHFVDGTNRFPSTLNLVSFHYFQLIFFSLFLVLPKGSLRLYHIGEFFFHFIQAFYSNIQCNFDIFGLIQSWTYHWFWFSDESNLLNFSSCLSNLFRICCSACCKESSSSFVWDSSEYSHVLDLSNDSLRRGVFTCRGCKSISVYRIF